MSTKQFQAPKRRRKLRKISTPLSKVPHVAMRQAIEDVKQAYYSTDVVLDMNDWVACEYQGAKEFCPFFCDPYNTNGECLAVK